MISLRTLLCLTGFASLPAFAQQATQAHPADPSAPVPAVRYESVFPGYTPYRDEGITSWRAANDSLAAGDAGSGGHGAHAPAAKPPAGAAASPPPPAPHSMHGMNH